MSKIINKAVARKFILDVIRNHRPTWGATRISDETYEKADAHMKAWLYEQVMRHPSKGKTVKL